jgi:hypothetical protein
MWPLRGAAVAATSCDCFWSAAVPGGLAGGVEATAEAVNAGFSPSRAKAFHCWEPVPISGDQYQTDSKTYAQDAGGRGPPVHARATATPIATPTGTTWATPAGTTPAGTTWATATATGATATTTAAPVNQLCVLNHARLNHARNILWRRSGIREPGRQTDGREAQRAGDCGRPNHFRHDHRDPLTYVTVSRKPARLSKRNHR